MRLQPYQLDELRFAYCLHVYYRWHSHWWNAHPGFTRITAALIEGERPDVRILNLKASETELALLASLRPQHSISIAASKIKGAVSKLTRQIERFDGSQKILGDGYFAYTSGPRTSTELNQYLDSQAEHHGYHRRVNPPVFVWTRDAQLDDYALQAHHTCTCIRWHVVFSTWNRQGAFSRVAAERVFANWQRCFANSQIRFIKVAFLPDHVHLALSAHPSVVPAALVPDFLNTAQELMASEFPSLIIRTGSPRVWKPSAYLGTVGKLTNRQLFAYLDAWQRRGVAG